jgi:hypothetical protein
MGPGIGDNRFDNGEYRDFEFITRPWQVDDL